MEICYECGIGLAQSGIVIHIQTVTEPRPVYQCFECYDRGQRLCCQQAHERGYRRGYADGYLYAVCDLLQALRAPRKLICQINRFTGNCIAPWVERASYWSDKPIPRDHGPRCTLAQPHQPQAAPDRRA